MIYMISSVKNYNVYYCLRRVINIIILFEYLNLNVLNILYDPFFYIFLQKKRKKNFLKKGAMRKKSVVIIPKISLHFSNARYKQRHFSTQAILIYT